LPQNQLVSSQSGSAFSPTVLLCGFASLRGRFANLNNRFASLLLPLANPFRIDGQVFRSPNKSVCLLACLFYGKTSWLYDQSALFSNGAGWSRVEADLFCPFASCFWTIGACVTAAPVWIAAKQIGLVALLIGFAKEQPCFATARTCSVSDPTCFPLNPTCFGATQLVAKPIHFF
jgi:hypothetical protein